MSPYLSVIHLILPTSICSTLQPLLNVSIFPDNFQQVTTRSGGSQPVPGRYVSVYLNKVSYLVLCEFQVHGTRVTAGKSYRSTCCVLKCVSVEGMSQ